MKNVWRKITKKEGFMTLLIFLFITSMLPLFLFCFVEIQYLYQIKDKAQYINDHVASAAVRSIDTSLLSQGIIEINEQQAQEIGKKLFQINYHLQDDWALPSDSFLKAPPYFKIYVVNSNVQSEFTTDEGVTFTISHPSVIVYSSIKPKGIFFNKLVNLQSYSIYEVVSSSGTPRTVNDLQFQKVYLSLQ